MSVRSAIETLLEADSTLMSTLTGGVHSGTEISRQETPTVFDANDEVQPCALLTVEADDAFGPLKRSSRMFVVLRFYDRSGYTNIDTALDRVYTLLNRQRVSGEQVFEIRHTGDVRDQRDVVLDCAMAMSRYQVVRYRG